MIWLYLLWPLVVPYLVIRIVQVTKHSLAYRLIMLGAFMPIALIALSPFGFFGLAILGDATGWFRIEDLITRS